MQRDLLLREDVSIFPIRDLFSFLLLACFHLVAYPVGSYTHLVNQMLQSYEDTARNRCESGWTFSMQHADVVIWLKVRRNLSVDCLCVEP